MIIRIIILLEACAFILNISSAGCKPCYAAPVPPLPIEKVLIPEGKFLMGFNELEDYNDLKPSQRNSESNTHLHYVPDFYISQYEITNAQYAEFIKTGSYRNKELWSVEGWEHITSKGIAAPYTWSSEDYNCGDPELFPYLANHPVVGITWYEAEAFAKWAGGRLPRIWEWEKAARGNEGYIYPWGKKFDPERCNKYYEDVIDDFFYVLTLKNTSGSKPVDYYSNGISPYGVYSMSGNVREYCQDWYYIGIYEILGSNDTIEIENGWWKEIRGGSYESNQVILRCSNRDFGEPGIQRRPDIGIRVVWDIDDCD